MQVKRQVKDAPDKFVINKTYHRILEDAFYWLFCLTPDQVCRLLYKAGGGSIRGVETSLKLLFEAGYLHRFHLPTGEGIRPFVYTLTKKSRDYLVRCGAARDDIYYIPYGDEEKNFGILTHLLELNDFLIIAMLAAKHTDTVRLFDMQHDIYFKSHPLQVYKNEKEYFEVVPDAFLYFKVKIPNGKEKMLGIWVELNRGNHSVKAFKRKFNAIRLAGQKGIIKERFGIDNICFAFVTPTGEERVEKMRLWTRQEIGRVDVQSRKNMRFKFLAVPDLQTWNEMNVVFDGKYNVRNILIGNIWEVAYTGGDDSMRVQLLDIGNSDDNGVAGSEYE